MIFLLSSVVQLFNEITIILQKVVYFRETYGRNGIIFKDGNFCKYVITSKGVNAKVFCTLFPGARHFIAFRHEYFGGTLLRGMSLFTVWAVSEELLVATKAQFGRIDKRTIQSTINVLTCSVEKWKHLLKDFSKRNSWTKAPQMQYCLVYCWCSAFVHCINGAPTRKSLVLLKFSKIVRLTFRTHPSLQFCKSSLSAQA